jgi:hypothetical protein
MKVYFMYNLLIFIIHYKKLVYFCIYLINQILKSSTPESKMCIYFRTNGVNNNKL